MRRLLAALGVVLITTTPPARAQNAVVTRNVKLRAGPASTKTVKERLHPPDELMILDTAQTNGYYEAQIKICPGPPQSCD
jgi:hypothetical protein